MTNPIWAALDTTDLSFAKDLAGRVRADVGGIKLGLEFFSAHGPAGVREMGALGLPIFLDLKLHDIPNTVKKAVEALAPIRPAILTVHAAGGRAMLEAAKAAAAPATRVVAVTMLTSLDAADLAETGIADAPGDQVLRLTRLARSAGLDGIVCAGTEVVSAHEAWPEGFLVVPGLRLAENAADDQKRVVTPRAARDGGASALVIGRPITGAADPAAAARAIGETL